MSWNGKRLKVTASVIGSLSVIVGSAFAIDARYARAADVTALKEGQAMIVRQTREETRFATDLLRKQLLEDKVFEINLVPEAKRTNAQRALLERYKAQVLEINARWTSPPSGSAP